MPESSIQNESPVKKEAYKTARVKREFWHLLPNDHHNGFVRVKYDAGVGMFDVYATMDDASFVGTMREDRLENFVL